MFVTRARIRQSSSERRPDHVLRVVVAIEVAVGIGAVYGGHGLLSDADGFGARQAWLEGSVFPDYTIPGLVLLLVIGGGMFLAAAMTLVAMFVALPAVVLGVFAARAVRGAERP